MKKLFAVCLGGRAEKCNTELHDIVFAIGETIEDTYEQLMEKWFGTPVGLHLDSWVELSTVDGHKITVAEDLGEDGIASGPRLYFVNLGAYEPGLFGELHANIFVVAEHPGDAKTRAKTLLHKSLPVPVHTDDFHAVEDCLASPMLGAYRIIAKKHGIRQELRPVNGYHPIPAPIVRAFMARRAVPAALVAE